MSYILHRLICSLFLACAFLSGLVAMDAIRPVHSATLQSGDIVLRLDGRKFDYMNSIHYRGMQFGTDTPGGHYGITALFKENRNRGYLGSGHKETGESEQLLKMELNVDGHEITLTEGGKYIGRKIIFQKQCRLKNLKINYRLILENNTIKEYADLEAEKDTDLVHIHFFMHPWSTDFTDLYAIDEKGNKIQKKFSDSNKMTIFGKYPSVSLFNRNNSYGIVSMTDCSIISPGYLRSIWDRKNCYRKDYLLDFLEKTIKAGCKTKYGMTTVFFKHSRAESWTVTAEEQIKKLTGRHIN